MTTRVLDENTSPTLRRLIGRLLQESETVDLALTRIRLAALDLTAEEIAGPRQCRVLIGRLDASTLLDAATPGGALTPSARSHPATESAAPEAGSGTVAGDAGRSRLDALKRLEHWIGSDRLLVRSAGIGAWTPDFSIFSRRRGATCLLGAHYFGHPQLTVGPSITVVTDAGAARALLAERFQELWGRAHDVAPAIEEVLRRAMAEAGGLRGPH